LGQEINFSDSQVLLSTTDIDSRIKYANASFCEISGYKLEELKNNPHNIVRHQDMPKEAFTDLWECISSGKSWMGPVKNKCKNGDFYWVNAYVTPIKDSKGKIIEFQSVRTKPKKEVVNRAIRAYQKLKDKKAPYQVRLQTDITCWIQSALFLLLFLNLTGFIFSGYLKFILPVSMTISSIAIVIFYFWRKKYNKVVMEAKEVFDNPLMSYLYSGNNDAIGTISLSIQKISAELEAVIGRISDDTEIINKSAEDSMNRGDRVATILNNQNMEIEQVATATNQMSATIQEILRIVTEASNIASEGQDISNTGQNNLSKTIQSMNKLSVQLSGIDNAITKLVNSSKSIEKVLDIINGFADQTNLLALNAAIEAARAGEHGKGFAVVAEEVRALALRTQKSTEEVNIFLVQLQEESSNAIDAINYGNELSKDCVTQVNETGKCLIEINEEISKLATMSSQIAMAIEEQSVVTEQINLNVFAISDMSNDSKLQSEEAKELGYLLLERLFEQHKLVEQFSKS